MRPYVGCAGTLACFETLVRIFDGEGGGLRGGGRHIPVVHSRSVCKVVLVELPESEWRGDFRCGDAIGKEKNAMLKKNHFII